jgi:hypothetical protein
MVKVGRLDAHVEAVKLVKERGTGSSHVASECRSPVKELKTLFFDQFRQVI